MSSSTKLPFLRNNFQSNALGGGKLFLNCIGHKKVVSLFNRFVSSTTVVSIVAFVFGCFCAPPAATFFSFLFVLFAFAEGEEVVVFFSSALLIIFFAAEDEFGGALFFFSSSSGGSTLALFDRPLLRATTGGGCGLALFSPPPPPPRALRRGGMMISFYYSNFNSSH
jgi:hypothetical protein